MKILSTLFKSSKKKPEWIRPETFLVDVRTAGEFRSGSVKNAVNIPLDEIPAMIARFKNKQHIIVFCRSGARSAEAKRILEKNGINGVIDGGTWQRVAQMQQV